MQVVQTRKEVVLTGKVMRTGEQVSKTREVVVRAAHPS